MKSALLGTNHPEVDIEPDALLQQAGITYLQRMAGYTPAKADTAIYNYPPLDSCDTKYADAMMSCFVGRQVKNINPRVPFLMVTWLLMGSENPYQLYRRIRNQQVIIRDVELLLQIVCGANPSIEQRTEVLRKTTINNILEIDTNAQRFTDKDSRTIANIIIGLMDIVKTSVPSSDLITWSMTKAFYDLSVIYGYHVYKFTQNRASMWCYLRDDELVKIIQSLIIDMVSEVKKA